MAEPRRRSSVIGHGHTDASQDADALANMGHKQELQRNFSMISMLGLAFAILNTWTALAASLNLALPSGGPSAVIWGLITAGVFNLCLAASMAEFLGACSGNSDRIMLMYIVKPRTQPLEGNTTGQPLCRPRVSQECVLPRPNLC